MKQDPMTETAARRIALFIDFENLVTNTGITPSSFDLQPSLDRLLEHGKVIFRRAYCDWSRFKEAKQNLHELGVELVDVPPSTRAGKNSADMRLVIDALELCYAREHIDTFVIASGDSDFVPLANKLRENDKYVIGLGVKNSTSPIFVKACDEFLYLRSEAKPRRDEPRRDQGKPRSDKDKDNKDKKPREIPEIAREVVQSLLGRATQPLNPSFIKETIVRKSPDFDERDSGFSSFNRLLEAMEKEGLLQRIQQGRQWYVVPKEGSAPAGKSAPGSADEGEEIIPDPEE
ncbi:MAG: NYN domain-containing protein [Archangium sp.]|nr:NYN domain-containing protein [Archangium sp.]